MLSVKARMTLEFERQRWRFAGANEAVILDTFGETPVRYYQRLGVLLDDPEAHAHDPQLVARLRRLRDARRASRSASRTDG